MTPTIVDFDALSEAEWLSLLTDLARSYKRVFGRTLNLTDELGELHACDVLGLNRSAAGNKGFDALDERDERVQIKARAPRTGDHVKPVGRVSRFHSWDFDYAVLVLFDGDYAVDAIWVADQPDLEALQALVRNPRVGVSVRSFIKVGHRLDV